MNNQSPLTNHLSPSLARWQLRALIIGIIAAIISVIGAFLNPAQFFHSYLFAWLFWVGLSFGALVTVMMQFLTGGLWGFVIRNLCRAAFVTIPMMALFFLPILFGAHSIFEWSNHPVDSSGYHHKAQYLNLPFFTGRYVFYFVVLILIAYGLRRQLERDSGAPRHVAALSAGGLIVYVLCMNFASTDWVMSLDPGWYSTVFVEVFASGQFLGALALMTALLAAFTNHQSPIIDHQDGGAIPAKAFHDLGNMLLAFIIFWAYVSFSQILIIWSGNLPKEISWYLIRRDGGWQYVAVALFLGELLLPFFLLLSRARKRNPYSLAKVCLLIIAFDILDNFWFVAPAFHPHRFYLHWLDVLEFVALGGFWFALFFWSLQRRPLLPTHAAEVFAHA